MATSTKNIYVRNPPLKSTQLPKFLKDFLLHRPATYYDEKFRSMQCYDRSRRSFADILRVCRAYYTDCTEREVAKALLSINGLHGQYCTTVMKYVFWVESWSNYKHFSNDLTRLGAKSYSLEQIQKLAK